MGQNNIKNDSLTRIKQMNKNGQDATPRSIFLIFYNGQRAGDNYSTYKCE